MEIVPITRADESERKVTQDDYEVPEGMMPCPICGHPMPDLKGGKATVCVRCGFKDSCCY
jgi:hypothetical protein